MKDDSQANAYRRLIEIGIALSSGKNLDSLLQHILLEAKAIANADGGTICLLNDRHLAFSIVVNDTLGIAQGGDSGEAVTLPNVPLYLENDVPNLANIASCVAHRGTTVKVDDASTNTEFDFSGTRKFDELLGYTSTSFLSVPLRTFGDECLGVLQLLNARRQNGEIAPFPDEIVPLVEALASQASVAIENRKLLDEQEALKRQLEREVDSRTEELKQALTKLSEAHIILKELNTIDPVTEVRNRQYFEDVLEQEWRRAKRQGYEISLLLLDIDHFKKVNDTYGHLAGDECLAAVAREIDRQFNRPSDVVARYGGEEFVVVLPYVDADNAVRLAEQLRADLESKRFVADGHTISITMSIGVATVTPGDGVSPRDLVGRADEVLYTAKASGRNQVVQYGTD
ncbi:MAG: sensor domain-containing diguanylate cyclase [Proteobacteria bacterium]|nr:sensor domain-containing diguanylate cyclase [Pseudomonadota bacterium]